MALDTGLNSFSTGFIQYCIKGSNPVDSDCKILLVGQMLDTGTATPNKPVQVIAGTENDLFGEGSILADMVRRALCACESGIYAVPLEGVGTAAEYTLPVVVDPVTEPGTLIIEAYGGSADQLGFAFPIAVAVGDTAADIAQAIADAINADADFPYTATVVGDDVILTAKNLGEIGNQLALTINTGDIVGATVGPETLTTPGAGVPDSAEAIENLGTCCFKCVAYQGEDQVNVDAWINYSETGYACGPRRCLGHTYHGHIEPTTAELVLAANEQNERAEVFIPIKEGFYYTSAQMAATWAAKDCCACCADPGRPAIRDNGILGCLIGENNCLTGGIWDYAELEALALAGAATWDANQAGQLQTELNYTTWKRNADGDRDLTWQKVESACAVDDFFDGLDQELLKYQSAKLFTDGTKLPTNRGTAVTPRILRNETIAYMRDEVGVTLDNPSQSFEDLVTTCINENDPDRADMCIGLPLVNSLLRLGLCAQVDVLNRL